MQNFGTVFISTCTVYCVNAAMDMPSELTALNITPRGALLRWNPPLSMVDNYVLTLTNNQGKGVGTGCLKLDILLPSQ